MNASSLSQAPTITTTCIIGGQKTHMSDFITRAKLQLLLSGRPLGTVELWRLTPAGKRWPVSDVVKFSTPKWYHTFDAMLTSSFSKMEPLLTTVLTQDTFSRQNCKIDGLAEENQSNGRLVHSMRLLIVALKLCLKSVPEQQNVQFHRRAPQQNRGRD